MLRGASYSVRVYPQKGYILNPAGGSIGVWSVFDDGEIPPLYLLQNSAPAQDTGFGGLGGEEGGGGEGGGNGGLGDRFTFNPSTKELFSNRGSMVEAFSFPEIF